MTFTTNLSHKLQALQMEREEELVKYLKDRLQPFVVGQTDEFVNWATSESRHLSKAGRTSPLPSFYALML